MNFIELNVALIPRDPFADILIAWLGEKGFDSFTETETGFLAYAVEENCPKRITWPKIIRDMEVKISHKRSVVHERNWNEEWEKNFTETDIEGKCLVRASFHIPSKTYPYEIIIDPKMAFGTAHHETTYMMIALMLEYEFNGKTVLDMGCGTGVLAILAEKMSAAAVTAIDNDKWAAENALENIGVNQCTRTEIILGDASAFEGEYFDIILANINRNILLNDIPAYARALKAGGKLFLSGFYEQDADILLCQAAESGLHLLSRREKNNWTAMVMQKSE